MRRVSGHGGQGVSFFFFFQAEDGIRDVERSRGLGDVYKRQYQRRVHGNKYFGKIMDREKEQRSIAIAGARVDEILGGEVLMNAHIFYDPEQDCQRFARSGYLELHESKEGADCHIFPNSGKYFPEPDDIVVGIVEKNQGMYYTVDIGAYRAARLDALEFEGATKRSKPKLEEGQAIYARVLRVSKFGGIELSCISPLHKKAWNTGESFFGPLSGGYILDCSQLLSRNLLEPDNRIVKTLGKKVNFELASGMNGRVHVKAKTVTDTILVVSLLQQSEHFSFSQMQKLFASTFKQSL
eukprot:TRINITY_DN35863_c0_g1_i2.p1 TRINITY_DN35863_c0_g1~~TRINITY_DN35863_c0_g1_i2.p1  ORF type:complete len:296 (+),score=53.14 TRINITY_DN35863_c0_g1_i2:30-917(+)